MSIYDRTRVNLQFIFKIFGITKDDLIKKLKSENIDFKPVWLNSLFGVSKKEIKPEGLDEIVSCLGLPLSLLTMSADELIGLQNFLEYSKSLILEHSKNQQEVTFQKRVKALERARLRIERKAKEKIAQFKKEYKKEVTPKIKSVPVPPGAVYVSGVISETRAVQFYSWCIKNYKKERKNT